MPVKLIKMERVSRNVLKTAVMLKKNYFASQETKGKKAACTPPHTPQPITVCR